MEKGRLRKEGESVGKDDDEKKDTLESKNEIVYDSMGNEIKVEKKVELSDKEKKKEIKSIQKQIAQGKKKGILTDDEIAELEDRLLELKSEE